MPTLAWFCDDCNIPHPTFDDAADCEQRHDEENGRD